MASVRMGEMAVSSNEELIALGLGSCIGLVMVDRGTGVAGLAHIVLPEGRDGASAPGRFADRAVPELLAKMCGAGARKACLEAVLAGGAQMFELGTELDIGARNESAVRAALAKVRIPIVAAVTGGNRGRTIKVAPGGAAVSVREAGGSAVALLGGDPARTGHRLAEVRS